MLKKKKSNKQWGNFLSGMRLNKTVLQCLSMCQKNLTAEGLEGTKIDYQSGNKSKITVN